MRKASKVKSKKVKGKGAKLKDVLGEVCHVAVFDRIKNRETADLASPTFPNAFFLLPIQIH